MIMQGDRVNGAKVRPCEILKILIPVDKIRLSSLGTLVTRVGSLVVK